MIRRRKLIRRRPLLESRGNRRLARRRRPLFESRSHGELESLARAIAFNVRELCDDVDTVMYVLKPVAEDKPEAIDEIFDEIDRRCNGDMDKWAERYGYNTFYDLEDEAASILSSDDYFVMPIPSHLLPYLVNGETRGLDDEELEQAEEIENNYSVESPVHSYDFGEYFDGRCMVVDYFVRPTN